MLTSRELISKFLVIVTLSVVLESPESLSFSMNFSLLLADKEQERPVLFTKF